MSSPRFQLLPLGGLLTLQLSLQAGPGGLALKWEQLPPIPEQAGLGGPYAGVSDGKLLVAGGSNFPERALWEGGKKAWHDTVYAFSDSHSGWREAGKLPRPMGYGVSVSAPAGVVCAGGSDARRHYRDVFILQWHDGAARVKPLPPLPRPIAYGAGALLGNTLYVAGGTETPEAINALRTFYALKLSEAAPAWQELDPWPGPARMLAVAAVQGGAFFLVSGTDLSANSEGKPLRHYLTDVYRYQPEVGWTRRADIPRAAVAAPSPAPELGSGHFLVLSGDDGTTVGFKPVQRHPGFAKDVLAYDTAADAWTRLGELPVTQVTLPAVSWQGKYILPNGEIRPEVRTPKVWSLGVVSVPPTSGQPANRPSKHE